MGTKRKRTEIKEDDLIRRLFAYHYKDALEEAYKEADKDAEAEVPPKERAVDLDLLIEQHGDIIHDLVYSICDTFILTAHDPDEEDPDDGDDDSGEGGPEDDDDSGEGEPVDEGRRRSRRR